MGFASAGSARQFLHDWPFEAVARLRRSPVSCEARPSHKSVVMVWDAGEVTHQKRRGFRIWGRRSRTGRRGVRDREDAFVAARP